MGSGSSSEAAQTALTTGFALLVASGDLRIAANQAGWPEQVELEANLGRAFEREGVQLRRAHPVNDVLGHGFIDSQRMGIEVFRAIDPDAPLVVAEAVWQYTHHVLAGLRSHRGPVLTVANWSGRWPGLVGLLNLNASLTKAGRSYSTLWSEDFADDFAQRGVSTWVSRGIIQHATSHVHDFDDGDIPQDDYLLGVRLARNLRRDKAILGVFDEGCMGMYNAIIDDELLNPMGLYKERLSQSTLYARMQDVGDDEASEAFAWLRDRGMEFRFGEDEATELTISQVLSQLKMYIAAVRLAAEFGCDVIGIQYQQGLKDLVPASDLAEGLLNNVDRPPVYSTTGDAVLYERLALPHFNEVDEGSAVDALVTNRVWSALALDPATTLHDVRWGEWIGSDFVWVFQISGAIPASHLTGGYSGAISERQSPVYFSRGGGTLKGVSRPGEIVWSRVFIMDGRLHADLGRGTVVQLPDAENERRWRATSYEWPIMNAVLHGVSRDQMMARHRANHIQVAYAPSSRDADRALGAKAAMLEELGVSVHICGDPVIERLRDAARDAAVA